MAVRLKFRVTRKNEFMTSRYNSETHASEAVKAGGVELYPVVDGSEENKAFYNATPSGKIEFGSINAEAIDSLPLNAECYITIEVAPPAPEK